MNHPLDGARFKIVRAQQHLDALKAEVGRYLASNPYEIPVENDGNSVIAKSAVIKTEPPLILSCIVGDCLTNLRASLDYIAWQLAVKYGANCPVVGRDRIFFPVSKDATTFNTNGRPNLAGFAPHAPALKEVEDVQPYQTGYESLGLLHRLVNVDKHCLPVLTVAYADTASLSVSVSGPRLDRCSVQTPGGTRITLRNTNSASFRESTPEEYEMIRRGIMPPTPALALNTPRPAASEQEPRSVQVDSQVTLFVSLKDAPLPLEPVDRTLEQIVRCAANIIPRFEPFF